MAEHFFASRWFRLIALLQVLLFFAGCIFSTRQPTVQFDGTVRDVGKVTRGEYVKLRYQLENSGNGPLTIERVGAQCGCTVVVPPPSRVEPGATATLEAALDTTDLPDGQVNRTLTFISNDPEGRERTLLIRAFVQSEFELSHQFLQVGPEGWAEMQVTRLVSGVRVVSLRTIPDSIDVVPLWNAGTDPNMYRLRVNVTRETAPVVGSLVIDTTSRAMPQIKVPINWLGTNSR